MRARRSVARNPFLNLRTFLEFWCDQRTQIPCCLFASDDEIATDVDQYDCQTCAVADALEALWPENRTAWILSRQLFTRFVVDGAALPFVLDRLTREQDDETFLDTLTRVSIIYDELFPPAPPPT